MGSLEGGVSVVPRSAQAERPIVMSSIVSPINVFFIINSFDSSIRLRRMLEFGELENPSSLPMLRSLCRVVPGQKRPFEEVNQGE